MQFPYHEHCFDERRILDNGSERERSTEHSTSSRTADGSLRKWRKSHLDSEHERQCDEQGTAFNLVCTCWHALTDLIGPCMDWIQYL